jgi:GT2 family glycosyltransferase
MTADVAASVIVSTHNRAHYLDDALGALAAQNCSEPFEVIIIDNASTDGTSKVLESWCRRDKRFRTAFEGRQGLSYGKNAGIQLARAPLLLFTDDDTLTDPQWISAYLDLFARRGSESNIAGGVQIPIPHDLRPWPAWFAEPAIVNLAMLDYAEERTLVWPEYVWGANMAVPRRMFQEFGGWDETIGRKGDARGTFEDTEFQDRLRAAGVDVWFCPDAIIRHRIARDTVTPRRIVASAFARGRNQLWKQSQVASSETKALTKRSLFVVLPALVAYLLEWALWVMMFRIMRRRSIFERARRAAYHSGRALETLHLGTISRQLFEVVCRLILGWRRVLLRLCPDSV